MTTKAELAALEKIFAAEIVGRLPFQSKAKIFTKLAEQGLVEPMVRDFGAFLGGSRFTAKGWALSQLGRLTYCASCDDVDDDEIIATESATNAQG